MFHLAYKFIKLMNVNAKDVSQVMTLPSFTMDLVRAEYQRVHGVRIIHI